MFLYLSWWHPITYRALNFVSPSLVDLIARTNLSVRTFASSVTSSFRTILNFHLSRRFEISFFFSWPIFYAEKHESSGFFVSRRYTLFTLFPSRFILYASSKMN